ncbi:hypothetical protein SRHO_G00236860 [Serrasalmus rhombeus]
MLSQCQRLSGSPDSTGPLFSKRDQRRDPADDPGIVIALMKEPDPRSAVFGELVSVDAWRKRGFVYARVSRKGDSQSTSKTQRGRGGEPAAKGITVHGLETRGRYRGRLLT